MTKKFPLQIDFENTSPVDSDLMLSRFLEYIESINLTLYPAQEEAILELFSGHNVILNTPTGSGKSLVATALHYWSLANGRVSYYTCPIKALVNQRFIELGRIFGPKAVGMATGDASVNPNARIICCTAEILSNLTLREGVSTPVQDVVMDEFHYYSDRDRGSAWQIPLLTLEYGRFLLMSATLGDPSSFKKYLEDLTGKPTTIIRNLERPVPLHYHYCETPLSQTLDDLIRKNQLPVYLVNFTQRECAEMAQDLLSINFCSKEEKSKIAEALLGQSFASPYGKELSKIIRHGIGIHHAGLLPRYRLMIEKLAQKGLLKVICGTDTLGVGVNVPIRSVLLTKLAKFDGQKSALLSVRDFHQICGRAGRKGFDNQGTVMVQAPEHVIENLMSERKIGNDPKKLRKLKRKPPPTKGYVFWDKLTFDKILAAEPETLSSNFQVSHGMLLNVLSRPQDGCKAMRQLIRSCHDSDILKERHRKQAFKIFRSLLERDIVSIEKTSGKGEKRIKVNIDLQDEFSIFHELTIWMLDTLPLLDVKSEDYALDLLTLVESIAENPRVVLLRQVDKLKTEKMAELKAQGMDFDERIEVLEKITYSKPNEEFIYETFNRFIESHPWLDVGNILPKSIARDMYQLYMSFDEYVKEYGLQRSEGLLLRYLSEVFKILTQSVPESFRNEDVVTMISFLETIVRQVDSSLLDEWQQLGSLGGSNDNNLNAKPIVQQGITKDLVSFNIIIRNELFRLLRALAKKDYNSFLETLEPEKQDGGRWQALEIQAIMEQFYEGHGGIDVGQRARDKRLFRIKRGPAFWHLEQSIVDFEGLDDWMIELEVDLKKSDEQNRPVIMLQGIKEID